MSYAYTSTPAKGTLPWGSGSNKLVLARARVRYDIDFSILPRANPADPPSINCGPISDDAPDVDVATLWGNRDYNLCTASAVRAVVPKIVYWSIKGG